jgi:hypothetical protein
VTLFFTIELAEGTFSRLGIVTLAWAPASCGLSAPELVSDAIA